MLFVVFLAIGFALHSPGFRERMVYDSQEWLAKNERAFYSHDPGKVLAILPVRPLFMATLYANYLWTGMDPYYFRAFNSALLALTGTTLVLLTALILEIPGLCVPGSRADKLTVSVFVGLWFVLSPLQSFVVLYVWQRAALLACLFYFAGLAVYVAVRSSRLERFSLAYALVALFFLASLMSKEHAASLPLTLFVAEATLFRQRGRQLLQRGALIILITLPPLAAYFLLTASFHDAGSLIPQSVILRLKDHYAPSGLTIENVLLTECRVWLSYLLMIIGPFVRGVQFMRPEMVSVSLWEPPVTVAALAGILGLLVTGFGLARRHPLASFGIFFFFITLLPESLIVAVYLFFGYRAILPMGGILIILTEVLLTLAVWLRSRWPGQATAWIGLGVLCVPLVWMGSMTLTQAQRWNPFSFWQAAFSSVPKNEGKVELVPFLDIITGYSGELVAVGRYEQAIEVLKLAVDLRIDPLAFSGRGTPQAIVSRKSSALVNLGLAHKKAGNLPEAAKHYRKAIEIDPRSGFAWSNLALTLEAAGDFSLAMQHHRKAVEVAPDLPESSFNLGCLLLREGTWPEAIPYFEQAVRLRPDYPEARANLGACLLHVGRYEEAVQNLSQAARRITQNAELYNSLGVALAETGRTSEAVQNLRRALTLEPDHDGARTNLESLLKEGRPQ